MLVRMAMRDVLRQSTKVQFLGEAVKFTALRTRALASIDLDQLVSLLAPRYKVHEDWTTMVMELLDKRESVYPCLCGSGHREILRRCHRKTFKFLECEAKSCSFSATMNIRKDRHMVARCPLCLKHRHQTVYLGRDDIDNSADGFGEAFFVCSFCSHIISKISIWVESIKANCLMYHDLSLSVSLT